MPSSITHIYFATDVYQKLPTSCQKKIDQCPEHFKLFCQGSDPFMFYHFLLGKKAKKIGQIQSMMHLSNTKKFFLSTITYIHQHHLIHNSDVMTYLYGYICHYYLDYYTHPFIDYKSGKVDKKKKSTYRYNGVHQEIEYMIDLYFIHNREHLNPAKYKVHQHLFKVSNFSNQLKETITYSIESNYPITNVVPIYLKSIHYMKNFFQIANYDPIGWKRKIYSIIDHLTPASTIPFSVLSFHNPNWKNLQYLNLDHQKWCYPWDQTKYFTESFLDLYNNAVNHAANTIQTITSMLENKLLDFKKLNDIFQDLSFATGKPCKEKLKYQYFEF